MPRKRKSRHHSTSEDSDHDSDSSSASSSGSSSSSDHETEEQKRERNRVIVETRSRQWVVVGSSDEDEEEPDNGMGNNGGAKHSGTTGNDVNAGSDAGDSSSTKRSRAEQEIIAKTSREEGSEKRRKKRKRKTKKRRDREKDAKKAKKSKKKSKKSRKDPKKDKKKRKVKKVREVGSSFACDQNIWGAHGTLTEADFFRKQREFESWMQDVKKLHNISGIPKYQLKEHFKEYMEDFNTSTFPHEKYYDMEAWDKKEYKRKLKARQKKQGRARTDFNDEEERRAQAKALEKRNAVNKAYAEMTSMDKEKAQAMREQQVLRSQMQMAWKAGNDKEYERLKKLLEAE